MTLIRHPFCATLDPAHVAILEACASEVSFLRGQLLARQGDRVDATWLIRRGRVALRVGRQTVETVEQDELLGWSWMFESPRWHVDAVAMGAVDAVRLDGACIDARMQADPVFGHALARCILLHVHRRLERARLRSLDVFGEPSP